MLQQKSFVIGSDPACDLALNQQDVLPRHLILQPRGEQWQASTLNLRAAAFINDRPLTGITLLHDGDRIRIGSITMTWHEQDLQGEMSTPWLGLLSILLVVLILMSALFVWFNFSGPNHPVNATPATVQKTKLQPDLQFQNLGENGHPLYHIVVPATGD